MARKKYTIEQIIVKLREVEVLCGQARPSQVAVRQKSYGTDVLSMSERNTRMNSAEAKQMKLLEKENARLKKVGGVNRRWILPCLKDGTQKLLVWPSPEVEGGDALCNGSPHGVGERRACRC